MVDASLVKELRNRTGAGMMDCKKALVDAEGDLEKAITLLREKGLSAAVKKSGRITSEGLVDSYIHMGGKIGVLVEVNCETDFVAKNDEFKQFVKNITMQIAAANPQYISRDEVPREVVDKEAEIFKAQAIKEGKPEKVIDRIIEGKIEKYYEEICLLEQAFIRDSDIKVSELLKETIAKLGENVTIRRFTRYEMGEGLEKKKDDLAAEVEAITRGE